MRRKHPNIGVIMATGRESWSTRRGNNTVKGIGREQYGDGAWADFEGLRVRVPEKYDDYLTQKYGDWRADLPVEQQIGHHFAEVIDLHRPYTDYIIPCGHGRIRIKNGQ